MIRQDKMQDSATYRPHPMPQINIHFRADHKVEEMSIRLTVSLGFVYQIGYRFS